MRLLRSRPRRIERLVELLGAERAAADPGQRHEACLLVLVQIGDEAFELGPRGIVAEGLEDGVGVMIGGGAIIFPGADLGRDLARLDDDVADLGRRNLKRRHHVSPPRRP